MSKVLLVDDEEDLLTILNSTFQLDGYETVTAGSGDEGYQKALEHHPDLVVTDVLMPHTSGFELCKKLKGNAQFADTPVILVTALYKGKESEEMAKSYGADAIVNKPFEPSELLAIAANLLATGKSKDSESNDTDYPLDLGDA